MIGEERPLPLQFAEMDSWAQTALFGILDVVLDTDAAEKQQIVEVCDGLLFEGVQTFPEAVRSVAGKLRGLVQVAEQLATHGPIDEPEDRPAPGTCPVCRQEAPM